MLLILNPIVFPTHSIRTVFVVKLISLFNVSGDSNYPGDRHRLSGAVRTDAVHHSLSADRLVKLDNFGLIRPLFSFELFSIMFLVIINEVKGKRIG